MYVSQRSRSRDFVKQNQNLGIKHNIGAFGGDLNNIAAVGQSVGASSIGLHLVSFSGTQGVPFQKAM